MTPSLACTGSSARWCPVCGDCACGPRYEGDGADGERTLDDAGCPLHGASSTHARDTAPDLAAKVLALAEALATAERDRDAAREAWATLAAAVRAEREASHARIAGELSGAAMVRARAALDALLRGAPCGYVPVPVVQRCLDAVDEWERERSAPVARTVARAAMVAARTALDAALAAATTTPKESP